MYAYGFSTDAVTSFYSYLERRKQNVSRNNAHSVFQILLSGVPQGSMDHFYSKYLLMIYISRYQKQTC